MGAYLALAATDPDGGVSAWFPDVPGCAIAADSFAELVAIASSVLAAHLDGEPLPEPRPMETLRLDPEVAEETARGAALLAVTPVLVERRTVKANLALDAGLLRAIDAVAKARGLTRSAFIAEIARLEIEAPRALGSA